MPHYPALDSLRFFAAFAVVLSHSQAFLGKYEHFHFGSLFYLFRIGNQGVAFFFVLSGFLITQVLLSQGLPISKKGLVNFYVRRAFRILPVYYLTLIVGSSLLWAFPELAWPRAWIPVGEEVPLCIALHVFLLPNVAYQWGTIPFIAHAWTIGIEEQFYLCWPWLLSAMRRPLWMIPICLGLLLWARRELGLTHEFVQFIFRQPFESMMVGAFAAVLHWKSLRETGQRRLWNALEIISLVLLAGLTFWPGPYPWDPQVFSPERTRLYSSLVYALLIVTYASSLRPLIRLDFSWLRYLGRISYGIYMYHVIALILSIRLCEQIVFLQQSPILFDFFTLSITLGLTLVFSMASWHFLEVPLLHRGKAFQCSRLNTVRAF